jgi:hypothetical protein
MEVLLELWDICMIERDRLIIFYFVIGILIINKTHILSLNDTGQLITYIIRVLRVNNLKELADLYHL